MCRAVPANMNEFAHGLTASELIRGYRERAYSPVEVVRALSTRIESLNSSLNAFTTLSLDAAESTARECERALMSGDQRPLLGLPVAIKDMIDTGGIRTTYGSSMFADHVPKSDAVVVRQLKLAGAIVLGKTSTHEFAWGFTTDNPHFGPTRNPWSLDYIAGGSSGGSAAAVAAGLVPVSIGTDTGGSIRVPAAFCGVAGLKPTYGSVSREGVFPLSPTLDHVGPIARDPRDLQLLLTVLQRTHAPHSGATAALGRPGSLAGVRIGVAEWPYCPDLGNQVAGVWNGLCEVLRDAGATVVDLGSLKIPDSPSIFAAIQLTESLQTHRAAGLYPRRSAEYGADVGHRLELAEAVTSDSYRDAMARREEVRATLTRALQCVDAIVSPCAATGPIPIPSRHQCRASTLPDLRRSILGYTAPQSLAGLPACAVRAGFDDSGLPVGVQFTGSHGSDSVLLEIASAFCLSTRETQERWPLLRDCRQSQGTVC